MKYEKIHTVHEYWDGPIEGVANYKGEPHKFKLLFDETKDDFSTDYELQKNLGKGIQFDSSLMELMVKME